MSKYGNVNVNISTYFTSNQIDEFAKNNGLTYDQAESIARNIVYRKEYQKLRNMDPKVQAKRKRANKVRYELSKQFKAFAR
jgi:hypothetical protein